MQFGLGELKLSPDQFWKLTPRELFAALGPLNATHAAPLQRTELDRLMAAFPDTGAFQT